jgi:DNA repair protein RadD
MEKCGHRFRFKRCDQCGEDNDIAARVCTHCQHLLVDNDKKLKEAMSLKDAHIMKPDTMTFSSAFDKKGNERIEVRYYDYDGEFLSEFLNSPEDARAFYFNFTRMHNRLPERALSINGPGDVLKNQGRFRKPMYVIARKQKYYWEIREKIF